MGKCRRKQDPLRRRSYDRCRRRRKVQGKYKRLRTVQDGGKIKLQGNDKGIPGRKELSGSCSGRQCGKYKRRPCGSCDTGRSDSNGGISVLFTERRHQGADNTSKAERNGIYKPFRKYGRKHIRNSIRQVRKGRGIFGTQ